MVIVFLVVEETRCRSIFEVLVDFCVCCDGIFLSKKCLVILIYAEQCVRIYV